MKTKTKGLLLTASMVLAMAFTFSCDSNFKDSRDGKTYKKVTIGSQTWMAENLNFAAEGSVCYENNPDNCAKYGRLYNWETAMKACPQGWHLPNNDFEWQGLVDIAGGDTIAGTKLKATSGWNEYEGKSGNGTDEWLSALPGGLGGGSSGDFAGVGDLGYWWSATEFNSNYAYLRCMVYNNSGVGRDYGTKSFLASVRCVKD